MTVRSKQQSFSLASRYLAAVECTNAGLTTERTLSPPASPWRRKRKPTISDLRNQPALALSGSGSVESTNTPPESANKTVNTQTTTATTPEQSRSRSTTPARAFRGRPVFVAASPNYPQRAHVVVRHDQNSGEDTDLTDTSSLGSKRKPAHEQQALFIDDSSSIDSTSRPASPQYSMEIEEVRKRATINLQKIDADIQEAIGRGCRTGLRRQLEGSGQHLTQSRRKRVKDTSWIKKKNSPRQLGNQTQITPERHKPPPKSTKNHGLTAQNLRQGSSSLPPESSHPTRLEMSTSDKDVDQLTDVTGVPTELITNRTSDLSRRASSLYNALQFQNDDDENDVAQNNDRNRRPHSPQHQQDQLAIGKASTARVSVRQISAKSPAVLDDVVSMSSQNAVPPSAAAKPAKWNRAPRHYTDHNSVFSGLSNDDVGLNPMGSCEKEDNLPIGRLDSHFGKQGKLLSPIVRAADSSFQERSMSSSVGVETGWSIGRSGKQPSEEPEWIRRRREIMGQHQQHVEPSEPVSPPREKRVNRQHGSGLGIHFENVVEQAEPRAYQYPFQNSSLPQPQSRSKTDADRIYGVGAPHGDSGLVRNRTSSDWKVNSKNRFKTVSEQSSASSGRWTPNQSSTAGVDGELVKIAEETKRRSEGNNGTIKLSPAVVSKSEEPNYDRRRNLTNHTSPELDPQYDVRQISHGTESEVFLPKKASFELEYMEATQHVQTHPVKTKSSWQDFLPPSDGGAQDELMQSRTKSLPDKIKHQSVDRNKSMQITATGKISSSTSHSRQHQMVLVDPSDTGNDVEFESLSDQASSNSEWDFTGEDAPHLADSTVHMSVRERIKAFNSKDNRETDPSRVTKTDKSYDVPPPRMFPDPPSRADEVAQTIHEHRSKTSKIGKENSRSHYSQTRTAQGTQHTPSLFQHGENMHHAVSARSRELYTEPQRSGEAVASSRRLLLGSSLYSQQEALGTIRQQTWNSSDGAEIEEFSRAGDSNMSASVDVQSIRSIFEENVEEVDNDDDDDDQTTGSMSVESIRSIFEAQNREEHDSDSAGSVKKMRTMFEPPQNKTISGNNFAGNSNIKLAWARFESASRKPSRFPVKSLGGDVQSQLDGSDSELRETPTRPLLQERDEHENSRKSAEKSLQASTRQTSVRQRALAFGRRRRLQYQKVVTSKDGENASTNTSITDEEKIVVVRNHQSGFNKSDSKTPKRIFGRRHQKAKTLFPHEQEASDKASLIERETEMFNQKVSLNSTYDSPGSDRSKQSYEPPPMMEELPVLSVVDEEYGDSKRLTEFLHEPTQEKTRAVAGSEEEKLNGSPVVVQEAKVPVNVPSQLSALDRSVKEEKSTIQASKATEKEVQAEHREKTIGASNSSAYALARRSFAETLEAAKRKEERPGRDLSSILHATASNKESYHSHSSSDTQSKESSGPGVIGIQPRTFIQTDPEKKLEKSEIPESSTNEAKPSSTDGRFPSGGRSLDDSASRTDSEFDDGVTLDLSIAEVSGLTTPTCIRSTHGERSSAAGESGEGSSEGTSKGVIDDGGHGSSDASSSQSSAAAAPLLDRFSSSGGIYEAGGAFPMSPENESSSSNRLDAVAAKPYDAFSGKFADDATWDVQKLDEKFPDKKSHGETLFEIDSFQSSDSRPSQRKWVTSSSWTEWEPFNDSFSMPFDEERYSGSLASGRSTPRIANRKTASSRLRSSPVRPVQSPKRDERHPEPRSDIKDRNVSPSDVYGRLTAASHRPLFSRTHPRVRGTSPSLPSSRPKNETIRSTDTTNIPPITEGASRRLQRETIEKRAQVTFAQREETIPIDQPRMPPQSRSAAFMAKVRAIKESRLRRAGDNERPKTAREVKPKASDRLAAARARFMASKSPRVNKRSQEKPRPHDGLGFRGNENDFDDDSSESTRSSTRFGGHAFELNLELD